MSFIAATRSTPPTREDEMEAVIGVAILLAIWIIIIWGSSYFNKNVK
jgi:hypothetical protein